MRLLNNAWAAPRLDRRALLFIAIAVACAAASPPRAQNQPAERPVALPTWPQPFVIAGPESAAFGFMVTQPGSVTIDITSNGAPIVAVLSGPGAPPTQQSGAGSLRLTHEVTPQEVQQGLLWSIRIATVNPSVPGTSTGTIIVKQPAVDVPRAMNAIQAGAGQQDQQKRARMQQTAQSMDQSRAQLAAATAARQARFEQQRQQGIAQEFEKLRPQALQAQARLGGTVQSRALPRADAATTSSAALNRADVMKQRPPMTEPAPPPTASSSQPIQAAGSTVPQQIAAPTITSLSITQGEPGQPVLVSGSGFGTGGLVHFIVNPGRDLTARIDVWSDTQIFASVPMVSGIQAFDGQMYVVRAAGTARSALVPFHFNPRLARRELSTTNDRILGGPYEPDYYHEIWHRLYNPFGGAKGDDQLFGNTRLRNGWMTSDAIITCNPNAHGFASCDGGAYLSELRAGTDSPYMKVHWWLPASGLYSGSNTLYSYSVGIVGPHGVPDGIACASAPCPDP